MFIEVTFSGPHPCVQLVSAFRVASGARKHRTVASLGLLDQLSSGLESVISSLLRVTGRTMPVDAQLNKTQPVTGLSTITQEHNAFLVTLDIKKPTLDPQMSLLYWSVCSAPYTNQQLAPLTVELGGHAHPRP